MVSGLTVEEMADRPARLAAVRARLEALGAPRGEVDARTQPFTLATLAERPFSDPAWLYEIKYDGVRVLADRRGDRVTLYGRSGQDTTSRYPEIVRALRALPVDRFVIDGEIVALDDAGRPSFQRLQPRMALTDPRDIELAARRQPAVGVFFDCLLLDDRDLRRRPLVERKECLRLLVPPLGPVRYGDHVAEEGRAFFEAASAQRLEGIVAKKARSVYAGGRTRDWIKIKCQKRQEFVIGGYTDPQGARGHFGALHLGLYDGPAAARRLVYVSKVGTGFDQAGLAAIWARLRPLDRATPPFEAGAVPTGRGHHWVEPRLVCEVRFTDWTEDGGLRHPTFLGLRDDRKPEECRRETAEPIEPGPAGGAEAAPDPAPVAAPDPAPRLKPTNLRKVFWPAEGYTKADLIEYYERVAAWMLPYLRDRPLVLTRFPDGIAGKSFYQKDAPEFAPAWVRTERIYSRDTERDIAYLVVDDVEMLRYVANSAAIPIHCWASRVPSLERPDWLVLDLDPKGAPFTDVVRVALALRRILDDLALPSYVKTSGATGLHILLPARRALHVRAGAHLRPPARGAGRRGRARDLHGGPAAPGSRRQGLHRLRAERTRADHRGPVLAAAAARRARLVPARVARGDPAPGSGALQPEDDRRALREDRRPARAGPGRRASTWPPRSSASGPVRPRRERSAREQGLQLAGEGGAGPGLLVLEVHERVPPRAAECLDLARPLREIGLGVALVAQPQVAPVGGGLHRGGRVLGVGHAEGRVGRPQPRVHRGVEPALVTELEGAAQAAPVADPGARPGGPGPS